MSFRKKEYTIAVANIIRKLAEVADVSDELHKEYFDNGYNSGGANPMTDQDFLDEGIDFTAAELVTVMTLLDQFNNFKGNAVVTTGDYQASINLMRRIRET